MPERLPDALQELLRGVSRSFYLTMRVLPGPIRPQISIAYLLARAGDTIADASALAISNRRDALLAFRAAVADAARGRAALFRPPLAGTGAGAETSGAEQRLLQTLCPILETLRDLPAGDRLLIGGVLDTITRGQERDLARFAAASAEKIVALESEAELDEYTYAVAGCVGEFWTHVCRNHLGRGKAFDGPQLLADAARYGKGLQLVNILRDIPADLRQGRCYIPRARLGEVGLSPQSLAEPHIMERFRPLYTQYLDRARDYLAAGRRYTAEIPRAQVRVRLACEWPYLIGFRTLDRLQCGNVLDPATRIKLPRGEVRRLIGASLLRCVFRIRPG
jgi:farnesyl-diphosphate farnesyltransferase